MEILLSTIFFILVLVWAFRVEIGVAKANEALSRIEEQLAEQKKGKK